MKESTSEKDNIQDIIPVEIDSEDDNIRSNIRTFPNSNKFSSNTMETSGALTKSKNSLKLLQDDSGRASILGSPINILGGDTIQLNDNIYTLTPELYKFLSPTSYTGKFMKNEYDISMMNIIKIDINYTGVGDKSSEMKTFSTKTFPELVYHIRKKTFEEITDSSDVLQGEELKVFIPYIIIVIYTRFENLLGLKPSGHTNTLKEAGNLINEIYKRGEIQNEQQFRNALNKFHTQ